MTTTAMIRQDAWRAMNVLYRRFEKTGLWPPVLWVLKIGDDLDPDALAWLENVGWAATENTRLGEKVSTDVAVGLRRPHDRQPGRRHDPTICSIGLTPAGVHRIENDPYQQALHKVNATRVWLPQLRVDGDVAAALVDADLVEVWDQEGPDRTVTSLQVALLVGSGSGAGWRLKATWSGRRVLGIN